ncbi:hypothetical protein H2200_010426 [Cladophialophora chaetospira]|uniref:F-box domain-containing protein n=1 Tax=Cladophialophora chaetospira TaxID=386627 RepID=A0AA38X1G3_9EURO|nr:hypothetical protein H2200_010426 [Cladophialophora chaetospira]
MSRLKKSQRPLRFWGSGPEDNVTVFKIPTTLDITPAPRIVEEIQTIQDEKLADTLITTTLHSRPHRQEPTLTTLPPEILLEIASHLHPVDRICLSLTCKTLLSNTLPALRITPADWLRFHYGRYSYRIPQTPNLYVRLANGWLPKDRFRYCRKCHKILPRCAEYFKQRLCKKRMPRFDHHVGNTGVTQKEWKSMGKRKRYSYFVEIWCRSSEEDAYDICLGFGGH